MGILDNYLKTGKFDTLSPLPPPCTVERILMRRDGESREDAHDIWLDLCKQVQDGANPEDVLYEVGLEPDYIFDIMGAL